MDTEKLNELRQIIEDSDNIVFFGGAGVSTESGIPDFRSVDGLYNQKYKYPPETIISHSFYRRNPEEFYRFYKDKMIFADAKPNKAHIKLAELEKQGKLKAVITQNIDGLHQMAGIRINGRSCLRKDCFNDVVKRGEVRMFCFFQYQLQHFLLAFRSFKIIVH